MSSTGALTEPVSSTGWRMRSARSEAADGRLARYRWTKSGGRPSRDTERHMSQENVEIVRRVFELGASREAAATALELYDQELVWDVSRLGLVFGRGIYHGRQGLRDWFGQWYGAWENARNELEDLIEAEGHVISIHTQRAVGRDSGIQVELQQFAVWTLLDRKIIRVTWFRTLDGAMSAAGVR